MKTPNLADICVQYRITEEDYALAVGIVGRGRRKPDKILAPAGVPYLYRWHVVPRSNIGNVYFHIQVADDPQEELHDHPWDNQSVILSGAYYEWCAVYDRTNGKVRQAEKRWCGQGAVIQRPATMAHRLMMPVAILYTMTLFSTGPVIRKWGYWTAAGWVAADEVVKNVGNVSMRI
jgi:hypothetical protein